MADGHLPLSVIRALLEQSDEKQAPKVGTEEAKTSDDKPQIVTQRQQDIAALILALASDNND